MLSLDFTTFYRQARVIITAALLVVVATVLSLESTGELPGSTAAVLLTMVGFAVIAAHRRQIERFVLAGPRNTLPSRASTGLQC
jgi:thiamine transporter ThiT